MKLTVKFDFGSGKELKVGTFSEIGRDSAFEFAGDFISSGLNPAPFRLGVSTGRMMADGSTWQAPQDCFMPTSGSPGMNMRFSSD